jgi:hypothetical protein
MATRDGSTLCVQLLTQCRNSLQRCVSVFVVVMDPLEKLKKEMSSLPTAKHTPPSALCPSPPRCPASTQPPMRIRRDQKMAAEFWEIMSKETCASWVQYYGFFQVTYIYYTLANTGFIKIF